MDLSELMKMGMKQNPMETAVWWLEYLSASKGANHLKISSRHLNFFQYFSLDFLFIVFMTFYLIFKIIDLLVYIKKERNKMKFLESRLKPKHE